MTALLARLDRWWFAPDARHQPGVWRIVLATWVGYRLWFEVLPRMPDYATRPPELVDPVSLAIWLGLPLPPPPSLVLPLGAVASLLVLTTLFGIATRASTVALALVHLYIGFVVNAWGYSAHASGLPTLALLVVAVSPGIDALSLDAWWAARRAPSDTRRSLAPKATPVWPLRIILLLLIATYLTAGISKLRHSGWEWTDGKTLSFYLSGGSLRDRTLPQRFIADRAASPEERFRDGVGLVDWAWVAAPTPLGRAIARSPVSTRWLSVFSLLLELAFPLALLGRRPLFVLLGLASLFHLGIKATMQISFLPYLVVYLMFVDWGRIARWIQAKIPIKSITNESTDSR